MENLAELHERYEKNIQGQLSCFDQIILYGTFSNIAYPDAMSWQLKQADCKLIDYTKGFANKLRLETRGHVEDLASHEGITIEHVNTQERKEALIDRVLKTRGEHKGIVHIISAMERCSCFKVGKNYKTGFLQLQWDIGKCLHYYIYFIDEEFGLCYMRMPTWAPCRLQVYLNGHNWLARQMQKAGINFSQLDNCFVDISDYEKAQEIADSFDPQRLHESLNDYAERFCACYSRWPAVHWSISQIEYATDIVFKSTQILPTLYEELVRGAVNEVQAADVYRFMGKRLTKASADEVSSRLNTYVQGTRLKHSLGRSSIKMYDKQDRVLRIETTTSNISFFKHRRKVAKRDGTMEMKTAAVKKTVHSLGVLRELMSACNRRYYQYISQLQDHTKGRRTLDNLSKSVSDPQGRSYRGINFFEINDLKFIQALVQGEHNISFTNRILQRYLTGWTSGRISRMICRFKAHRLIKRVKQTYKYYLTKRAKSLLFAHLQLTNRVIIPALAK